MLKKAKATKLTGKEEMDLVDINKFLYYYWKGQSQCPR